MRLSQVPSQQRPLLRFLLVLTVASTVGLQGWRTLFNNFAVEGLPAVGGALWVMDYRIPFVFAAVLSAIPLVAVQRIPGALAAAGAAGGRHP
ncbi:MAG: hypothetical protein P1P84_25335 [Deferrisomatales bacterium]|nr:hypothetical protein [Deferrisomatales bacterium]